MTNILYIVIYANSRLESNISFNNNCKCLDEVLTLCSTLNLFDHDIFIT
jgi:hypothetical protein